VGVEAAEEGGAVDVTADETADDGVAEVQLNSDDTTEIHVHTPVLSEIRAAPLTVENWARFENVMAQVTADARAVAKVPDRAEGNRKRTRLDVNDAQGIQTVYRRNRRRAIRAIVEGEGAECEVPTEEVEAHFREVWAESQCDETVYEAVEGREPIPIGPFTSQEVRKRLMRFENTAPGDDGLTYKHWRRLDPECILLTLVLDICARYRRIPAQWKRSVTVLIPKKGDPAHIANWRPIAMCRTVYKLLVGCVADRLTKWAVENAALSPGQKGFMPADGAFEHTHTLNRLIEKTRCSGTERCVAWLDVSNAFGAVPHSALITALRTMGAGSAITELVRDIYDGSTSAVSTGVGTTGQIDVKSGIKQGCPLSGLLFNLAVDHVIRAVQADAVEHRVLAFADDLCVIADSPAELQTLLDVTTDRLRRTGLHLNPGKCVTMHMSGRTPVGVRDTRFSIDGQQVRPLRDGEATTFLGAQVGFQIVPRMSTVADITQLGLKVLRSKLAPWQRIDAMKTFVYPAVTHLLRVGDIKKTDWEAVDNVWKPEYKITLGLPQEASNDYLYGHRKGGACGIPLLAEESDVARVDTAFKLLTSPDERVATDATEHLKDVVHKRAREPPDIDSCMDFLSGANEGQMRAPSAGVANVWTRARKASRQAGAVWRSEGTEPVLTVPAASITLRRKQRRQVFSTMRQAAQTKRIRDLIDKPDQGRAIECAAAHPVSNHFLRGGEYTRFADWRFVHKARLNLVHLNGSAAWRSGDRRCRRCGYQTESLAHVVDHCMRYSALYLARHNAVVQRIKTAAARKFEIVAENRVVGSGNLRPDMVLRRKSDGKTYIVDVTIPFDNRMAAFKSAAEDKAMKYGDLAKELPGEQPAEVVPFIVGALGAWDPANDSFMAKLCSRSYATQMRKLCVSDVIAFSRDIYVEHLTGTRQREI